MEMGGGYVPVCLRPPRSPHRPPGTGRPSAGELHPECPAARKWLPSRMTRTDRCVSHQARPQGQVPTLMAPNWDPKAQNRRLPGANGSK